MRGTSDDYRHRPDTTITRSNIAKTQAARTRAGLLPQKAEAIVDAYIQFPEPRHYRRAEKLMAS